MKDIYENADSVKIYLGEEEFLNGVSSNRAFDLLENFLGTKMAAIQRSIYRFGDSHGIERELRKGWYQHYTLNFNSDDIASNDADLMSAIDSMRRYLIDAALGDFWVAFFSLLEKPWWRRCWVIQEVIVARKATINGGDMAVDFDDFVLFLVMALWSLRIRIPGEESNDRTVTLSRMLFTCMQQPYRIAGARVEFDVQTATPMSLLRTFAYAKASDSRDKVYSTLSLLGRERAQGFGLTPTYAPSNTTAAVFIQAAKACITSSEELEVFSETYGASPDSHFGLPSWVPDWTRTEENTNTKCNLIHKIYGFSATGRPGMASSADVTYSYDGLKVLARGILIGKVSSIGAVDEEPDLHTTDNLNNILFTLRSWKQLSKPKSGTEMRQFCQTVTLEQHPPLDALGWDNPNTFEEWVRSLVQTGRRAGLGRPWYRRRFCQLSHGSTSKMAVLPASAEAGDIVCVFWGANVPFVLKERGKWCYLAGEAYVHGVMHGELIEEEDRAWRESAYFGIA
ncbi:hypothetical protein LTR72_010995 [Exophiala xenobiotica]|nr:hypothetical protein LTR92_011118 [Exophiala xenobiotica]KAK5216021.1 hypothetical protein LTR72_010995 [Exophiala xenobiotica]KAK5284921.1 hypothetical protein LTR14_011385 [Exophiala xenobiotica]KAK5313382.1 hypothetical protein LTR93_010895 [Exophiala xenobiotica]KAK5467026.1 hypothetical protein LTR55_011563 [Exophiala xenobiotica]